MPPPLPFTYGWQGFCTTLGGLCILDAKQLGRILYGSGPWMKLTLVNMRLVNGNSRDECGCWARPLAAAALRKASASCLWRNAAAASAAPLCIPIQPACRRHEAVFTRRVPHSPSRLSNPLPAAGGAVLLEDGGSLEATNCAFERNWGRYGGAIDVKVGHSTAGRIHARHLGCLPACRLAA